LYIYKYRIICTVITVTLVILHLFIVMEINTHTDTKLSDGSFKYIFVIRILDDYAPLYLISKRVLQKENQGGSNIIYIVNTL